MREVFQYKDGEWVLVSYACQHCTETFKTVRYCTKHELQCKELNTIKKNKEELNMPIQRVTRGGQSFYRKGQDGKLYKTKEEAESGKKKGVDGKACWEGYRYAGTKNGKDNCVKVKGR